MIRPEACSFISDSLLVILNRFNKLTRRSELKCLTSSPLMKTSTGEEAEERDRRDCLINLHLMHQKLECYRSGLIIMRVMEQVCVDFCGKYKNSKKQVLTRSSYQKVPRKLAYALRSRGAAGETECVGAVCCKPGEPLNFDDFNSEQSLKLKSRKLSREVVLVVVLWR